MNQNINALSNIIRVKKKNQTGLFPDHENVTEQQLRPIHYLGSKLRILDFIQNAIDEIDPTCGRVCDLFAGSGTVSTYLSKNRPVTSVDIQEYSRVLCSALLKPSSYSNEIGCFIDTCKNSNSYNRLMWCSQPLVEYEKFCMRQALEGNPLPLCELLENGSIIGYEQDSVEDCSADLQDALECTVSRIASSGLTGPESLVLRYFGGLYFSYLQAVQLDILLGEISNLQQEHKNTFLAALLSTTSDIVNTVGKQFAQPLKPRNSDGSPKKNIAHRSQKDRAYDVFDVFEKWLNLYLSQDKPKYEHHAYKMDYSDALDELVHSNVKVVYADPPYTRYHYSRYYHVLETICLRDNPLISKTCLSGKDRISRGVYRIDRHQSPFSIKSQATEAFEILFQKVNRLNASLVLSYSPFDETKKSTPRVNTVESLEKLARRYFTNVERMSVGQFSHSKLNQTDKNFDKSYNAELLIICR